MAIEILTEVQIAYKDFTPANNIKARLHIINGDWDQVLETVQQTLVYEYNNIEAIRIYVFYLLSRESDPEHLTEKINELMQSFDATEPKNAQLYNNYSQLFARICGRKKSILTTAYTLINKANALSPESSAFNTELGYQLCLQSNYKDAFNYYQSAAQYD